MKHLYLRPALPWLLLAAFIAALDQGSKWLITQHFAPGKAMYVSRFLNLVRAHNSGAAFSFLADAGGWQRWLFIALASGAILLLTWLLLRHAAASRLYAASLGLLLGGAAGNLIDRARLGYVVDFLDFHWNWLSPFFLYGHFPAFNIADAAITVGVIGLLLNEALAIIGGFGRKRVI